jgi:MFS family permease
VSPVVRAARRTFSSLSIRNYRLFFWGQLVSNSGTWMQWVAQGWLVLRLGGTGIDLGIVTALQFLPTFVGGLWAGLIADRFNKRRILIVTQSIAGMLALVLGALTLTGVVQLWMVYLLALGSGFVSMIDTPARHSFVAEMVKAEHLPNAVSLNAAVFNGGRIIGPALAAVLIATAGIAPSFFVNGVSYAAVVAALLMMDTHDLMPAKPQPRARGQLRAGLSFVWHEPLLRTIMILVAVVATFGMNFTVLLPLLAKNTFHGGAGIYGGLSSVMAAGALIGALTVAWRARPTWRILTLGALGFAVFTIFSGLAPEPFSEGAVLMVAGAANMIFISSCNTLIQLRSKPEMRGRVAALYSLVFLGGTALGGPIAGWVGQVHGARVGFVAAGSFSVAAALWARLTYKQPVPAVAKNDDQLLTVNDLVADATERPSLV